MNKTRSTSLFFVLAGFLFAACSGSGESYVPKPKGFNRIEFPPHEYQKLEEGHPYSFEYSKFAEIRPDTFGMSEPHWIIVYYPEYDARIQLTYKPLNGDLDKLSKLVADAYKLAGKHHVRASGETDKLVQLKNGKKAVVIELEGEVPSHYQFYVTDTLHHYLRGALYLMEPTLNDSLRPVVDYMKADCRHLLETLTWK
ncbi:gliding motility lipoprotein GldD [Marinilongibacter aquaticus]|uniref:gliding motility lipoprotein GldD n=1 Tax=Marinilongibacter aquaticus TaxID=2975157 RepID=UPI0021BDAF79|nr:gliding motility lipoprotein GldD [Marinilongibacter aquaticus]UBM60350.1 gliding motility lipoprotein GldD [Marinilongibacter aquaticus]